MRTAENISRLPSLDFVFPSAFKYFILSRNAPEKNKVENGETTAAAGKAFS